jgi:hypothetical protein
MGYRHEDCDRHRHHMGDPDLLDDGNDNNNAYNDDLDDGNRIHRLHTVHDGNHHILLGHNIPYYNPDT